MQRREYTFLPRVNWPPGPWDSEPLDKIQYEHKTGLPIIIRRNGIGAWCGYVGVFATHPLYGKDAFNDEDFPRMKVHGGVTFSGPCSPDTEELGICHVPDPGEPDNIWWFGFDCSHHDDLAPMEPPLANVLRLIDAVYAEIAGRNDCAPIGQYRTQRYVEENANGLATQLAALT